EGLDLLLLRVVSADQRVVVRQLDWLAPCAAVPVRFGGGCRLRGQISRSRDRIVGHRLLSQFGLFPAPVRLGVVCKGVTAPRRTPAPVCACSPTPPRRPRCARRTGASPRYGPTPGTAPHRPRARSGP